MNLKAHFGACSNIPVPLRLSFVAIVMEILASLNIKTEVLEFREYVLHDTEVVARTSI